MQIVELDQNSEAWLEWRKAGIGASEAPVVEGISPYRTIRDLFLEKKGVPRIEDEDKSYIFSLGHKTEGLIRKEFQDLMKVEMNPICLVHPEFGYIRASLDGFDPKFGVLEAKLVGQDVLKNARNGVIPKHHYSQMQHQMETAGCDISQYFAHDGKKSGVLVEVKADKEYIKRLLDLEHNFWRDVQENRIPPLSDRDYLIPEDQELLREIHSAKVHAENASAYLESLKEAAIKKYAHSKIAGAGVKIYKSSRQGSIAYTKIPEVEQVISALDQAYLEKFRGKATESWSLKIDEKKS